jgi:integrase
MNPQPNPAAKPTKPRRRSSDPLVPFKRKRKMMREGVEVEIEEEHYSVRFEFRGKSYLHSCGTPVLAVAKKEGERFKRETIEAVRSGNWANVDQLRQRSGFASLGEIFEMYEAWPVEKPRLSTRRGNLDRARQVLAAAMPGRAVDSIRTSELSPALLGAFVSAQKERAGTAWKRYADSEEKVVAMGSSVASTVTQFRSLFSVKALSYYHERGLRLPDLEKFLAYHVEKPARPLPEAPDMPSLHRLLASGPELRLANPGAYVGFLLIAELGLRPIEILAAREWWIYQDGPGYGMSIIKRREENFDPKGNQGHMSVSKELVRELESFKHLRTDGFLVPGKTKTQREDAIRRDLSEWCGRYITDREKATYELRRYAGSRMLDATGNIVDVQRFLRHRDSKTTLEWYAYRLQRAAALPMAVRLA